MLGIFKEEAVRVDHDWIYYMSVHPQTLLHTCTPCARVCQVQGVVDVRAPGGGWRRAEGCKAHFKATPEGLRFAGVRPIRL